MKIRVYTTWTSSRPNFIKIYLFLKSRKNWNKRRQSKLAVISSTALLILILLRLLVVENWVCSWNFTDISPPPLPGPLSSTPNPSPLKWHIALPPSLSVCTVEISWVLSDQIKWRFEQFPGKQNTFFTYFIIFKYIWKHL